jgi:hypothetical protein
MSGRMRTRRFTIVWASALAAFAVLAPAAFAGPGTYYAGPAGSGTTCELAAPCALTKAVEKAVAEDVVIVEPGTYTLAAELTIGKAIELGGQPGGAPPVIATNGHAFRVNQGAHARVHDLRLEGTGAFQLFSGTGERIFVSFTGTTEAACGMAASATLLNSLCWAHGSPSASTAAIGMSISGTTTTMTLRNDTAIDADSGDAIHTRASGVASKLTVEATNVIARAENHPDVEVDNTGSGFPVTEVRLSHSNYATVSGEAAPLATITAPGTNDNQTAAPAFVDAPGGDFREAAGSPTIGAGLTEDANGLLALGGEARSLRTCAGGPPVTDIGAYQLAPAPCDSPSPPPSSTPPTSSPPPPPPVVPNRITFGKLKMNKKKGTATLAVNVPGAGTLALGGKGFSKVFRSSKGATTLRLPIKPVGKTKAELAKTGKAVVAAYLTFAPVGGTTGRKTEKTIRLFERK